MKYGRNSGASASSACQQLPRVESGVTSLGVVATATRSTLEHRIPGSLALERITTGGLTEGGRGGGGGGTRGGAGQARQAGRLNPTLSELRFQRILNVPELTKAKHSG